VLAPQARCVLDIGPIRDSVIVEFPVQPVSANAPAQYEWVEDFPPENLLGMESVLDKRLLCFTPTASTHSRTAIARRVVSCEGRIE